MSTKLWRAKWAVASVILGLGILFLGAHAYTHRGGQPTCAGTKMHPGDVCVSNRGGRQSYSAKKEQNKSPTGPIIFMVFGGIWVLSSGVAVYNKLK
jgi:hypothetical protein